MSRAGLTIDELAGWVTGELARPSVAAAWMWAVTARIGVFESGTELAWGSSRIAVTHEGGGWLVALAAIRNPWSVRFSVGLGRELEGRATARDVSPPADAARGGTAAAIELSATARLEAIGPALAVVPGIRAGVRTSRPGSLSADHEHDLLSPYTSVGLGLDLGVELRPWRRLGTRLAIGVDPIAELVESPDRAGDSNPPDSVRFDAEVDLEVSRRWSFAAGFEYRRIAIQHAGAARATLSPAPIDVVQSDEAALLWLGIQLTLAR